MKSKSIFTFTICALTLSLLWIPSYNVEAKTTSKVKQTYARTLKSKVDKVKNENSWYADEYTPYFRLDDIDGNGVKELILIWVPNTTAIYYNDTMPSKLKEYTSSTDMTIFTYYKGKVKTIVDQMSGGGQFPITYDTKKHVIVKSWKSSYLEGGASFYTLSKGKLKILYTLSTEAGENANEKLYFCGEKEISQEDFKVLGLTEQSTKVYFKATKKSIKKHLL